jgi:rod shape-determining protein MreC
VFLMVADGRWAAHRSRCARRWPVVLLPLQRRWRCRCNCGGGGDYLQGWQALQARGRRPPAAGRAGREGRACRPAGGRERAPARAAGPAPALQCRTHGAEVLYEAADPYSRKLFIDRGQTQGVWPARR